MSDLFAEHLLGMPVIGSDGIELGRLHTLSMNVATGVLSELLIEPLEQPASDTAAPIDEDGWIHIPVDRVQAVNDYIIVTR